MTLLLVGFSVKIVVCEEARPTGETPKVEIPAQSAAPLTTADNYIATAEMKGGNLISVNFQNADILEVIAIFSEKTGLNMVAGPDVKAMVNIELNNMPWEKALDVILKNYNLTYKREDSLIRIMTLEQMKLEEDKIPLVTKVLTFNFSKADDVKGSFGSMLSSRGKIEVNSRTNSLIITDLPESIEKIEAIANSLDTRTPQVMIEALMADVKLSNEDQLGIQWKLAKNDDKTAIPYGKSGKAVGEQTLGLSGATTGSIFFGQTILKYTDFVSTISFWQEQRRVNILAHPVIMTLDNQSAHIELIEQIPYTQQTSSTESSSALSTTSFKDAGIKMDVTPHITTKDDYISMNLKVEQSFRTGFVSGTTQPIIDSRKAETNLLVKNGETIVIGGLRKKEDTFTIDKIPFLGDIPLFGALFRRRTRAVTDVDLLIFVTPKIVSEPKLTEREQERLEQFTPTPEDEKKFDIYYKKSKPKAVKPKAVEVMPPPSEAQGKKENLYLRPPS